ncbi:hypothetical protein TREAZ_0609 [Leadbettera azotonutricia ZAS-9]|uniref:Uncharacterized protein n=1 Tax=Leadbettera azotonutricia (strain ATCC BAA-888 / DSM 13862 / ZAS-9) TaxID=545695 RepID=F5YBH6_LEAAZ|nr:hypothetical protein TREAZ_0609 [Leadbettera azotonutricia ZAS-9]
MLGSSMGRPSLFSWGRMAFRLLTNPAGGKSGKGGKVWMRQIMRLMWTV